MIHGVLGLVAAHGAVLLLPVAMLATIGLPIPASLALLAAGSFAASGEMRLESVAAAALAGAMLGDQVGYWFGRKGGGRAQAWVARRGMGAALARARAFSGRWGDTGNFLSRWLVSPLGPAVNLLSGMVGAPWTRFTAVCLLGEAVWVALYLGLGISFSRSILGIARIGSDLGLFLAAAIVAALLALRLRAHRRAAEAPPS